MSGALHDFLRVVGWIVVVQVGLWMAKRVMFDCDAQEAPPQPRRRKTDTKREPHWIDPALNFYGVEVKGRDE